MCIRDSRIIDGKDKSGADRPRSSMKMHTDIWAADPADTVMCHIHVHGDIQNNGINLWEPSDSIYPDYIKPFDDFNVSAELKDFAPYNLPVELGRAYFLDSYVLHQTVKNSDNLRMTLTIPMIYSNKLESDVVFTHGRHSEYIPKDEWLRVGRDRILYSQREIGEYTQVNGPNNSYADKYSIKNLL